jgi:hypothetical protein
MLNPFALLLGVAMVAQGVAQVPASETLSGTIITADEIATTLKASTANNVVDQPIKASMVPGGHKASSRCCGARRRRRTR